MHKIEACIDELSITQTSTFIADLNNAVRLLKILGYDNYILNIESAYEDFVFREISINDLKTIVLAELHTSLNTVLGMLGVHLSTVESFHVIVAVLDSILGIVDLDDASIQELKIAVTNITGIETVHKLMGFKYPELSVDIVNVTEDGEMYIGSLLDKDEIDFSELHTFNVKTLLLTKVLGGRNSIIDYFKNCKLMSYKNVLEMDPVFLDQDIEEIRTRLVALYIYCDGKEDTDAFLNFVIEYIPMDMRDKVLMYFVDKRPVLDSND